MPFRKLKLFDTVKITYLDADKGESEVKGEVMHVGKNRDIIVVRDIETDENYHVHVKDVKSIKEFKT